MMRLDAPTLRGGAVLAFALVVGGCDKKAGSGSDAAAVPDVSADAPDAAAGSVDDDQREISRHQLTTADLRKLTRAHENMKRLVQQQRAAPESEEEFAPGAESLSDIAAEIERTPQMRKAVEDAGLTARQYALMSFALMQASVADLLVKQGAKPDSVASELGIHPANLRFVREHEAEIARLNRILADSGG
jgi:hypothetical protein